MSEETRVTRETRVREEWHLLKLLWMPVFAHVFPCQVSRHSE